MTSATINSPRIWSGGDWNAFFGYGSNLLVNVLTLTGLLRFVVGMPAEFVYGRVLPSVGVMLFLSGAYYSWLAYDLAKRTGRTDVCALPSGPGVGHIFIVTFAVMLPIKHLTGDYMKAWEAGIAWVFLQSLVMIAGGFAGQWIRKVTPRAALLSALAGIALTYIAITPIATIFTTPVIGLVCLAIVLLDWLGGVRLVRGAPAGVAIVVLGAAIAWTSNLFGLNYGGLTAKGLTESFTELGFRLPVPAFGHVFSGFQYIGLLVMTAVPFGVYDIIEAIDNVESAAGAGDSFPTSRVLTADGVISAIGALLGGPFMLVVYVGHPGWKAMGGRLGYAAASGLMVLGLCLFGILPVALAAIPIAAVYPILLFIAMVIGAQAFQETPARHAPAIILGVLPALANWGAGLVSETLKAAGVGAVTPQVSANLADQGVMLQALQVVGDGSALTGIVLAGATVFIIDGRMRVAATFCAIGAASTWFGLMHSSELGFGKSPVLALAYLLAGGVVLLAGRRAPQADGRGEPEPFLAP
jgi:adenine/guanine/hypoxanthine permease